MLASLIQIDYMFFEKDNGMCKYENRKIKITLFETYCCGCVCPCGPVPDAGPVAPGASLPRLGRGHGRAGRPPGCCARV